MVGFHKRSLTQDIDISLMRELRYQGATNKMIAEKCGCSVATVYKYLGKKSRDVQNCSEQNKPCPVKKEEVVTVKNPEPIDIPEPIVQEPKPILELVKEVKILDFKGFLCNYHVDQMAGNFEMDGMVVGLMDKTSLSTFIKELQQIETLL